MLQRKIGSIYILRSVEKLDWIRGTNLYSIQIDNPREGLKSWPPHAPGGNQGFVGCTGIFDGLAVFLTKKEPVGSRECSLQTIDQSRCPAQQLDSPMWDLFSCPRR